ncbi:MAG: hypothetical protein ACK5IP_14105, partial [Paracoccus sp. (in: a-proteobacteria)]
SGLSEKFISYEAGKMPVLLDRNGEKRMDIAGRQYLAKSPARGQGGHVPDMQMIAGSQLLQQIGIFRNLLPQVFDAINAGCDTLGAPFMNLFKATARLADRTEIDAIRVGQGAHPGKRIVQRRTDIAQAGHQQRIENAEIARLHLGQSVRAVPGILAGTIDIRFGAGQI